MVDPRLVFPREPVVHAGFDWREPIWTRDSRARRRDFELAYATALVAVGLPDRPVVGRGERRPVVGDAAELHRSTCRSGEFELADRRPADLRRRRARRGPWWRSGWPARRRREPGRGCAGGRRPSRGRPTTPTCSSTSTTTPTVPPVLPQFGALDHRGRRACRPTLLGVHGRRPRRRGRAGPLGRAGRPGDPGQPAVRLLGQDAPVSATTTPSGDGGIIAAHLGAPTSPNRPRGRREQRSGPRRLAQVLPPAAPHVMRSMRWQAVPLSWVVAALYLARTRRTPRST